MQPEVISQLEKLLERKLEESNSAMLIQFTQLLDQKIECELSSMRDVQAQHSKQINEIQREQRNNNLVFHGLKSKSYGETIDEVLTLLDVCGIPGVKYCIKHLVKLGKGNWGESPVLVLFSSYLLKIDILRKKKEINEKFLGISVKEDLPETIRKVRGEMRKFSEKAREKNIKVFMKGDKLVIHGKSWSLKELQDDKSESYLKNSKRIRDEEKSPNIPKPKKLPSHSRKTSIDQYFTPQQNDSGTAGITEETMQTA